MVRRKNGIIDKVNVLLVIVIITLITTISIEAKDVYMDADMPLAYSVGYGGIDKGSTAYKFDSNVADICNFNKSTKDNIIKFDISKELLTNGFTTIKAEFALIDLADAHKNGDELIFDVQPEQWENANLTKYRSVIVNLGNSALYKMTHEYIVVYRVWLQSMDDESIYELAKDSLNNRTYFILSIRDAVKDTLNPLVVLGYDSPVDDTSKNRDIKSYYSSVGLGKNNIESKSGYAVGNSGTNSNSFIVPIKPSEFTAIRVWSPVECFNTQDGQDGLVVTSQLTSDWKNDSHDKSKEYFISGNMANGDTTNAYDNDKTVGIKCITRKYSISNAKSTSITNDNLWLDTSLFGSEAKYVGIGFYSELSNTLGSSGVAQVCKTDVLLKSGSDVGNYTSGSARGIVIFKDKMFETGENIEKLVYRIRARKIGTESFGEYTEWQNLNIVHASTSDGSSVSVAGSKISSVDANKNTEFSVEYKIDLSSKIGNYTNLNGMQIEIEIQAQNKYLCKKLLVRTVDNLTYDNNVVNTEVIRIDTDSNESSVGVIRDWYDGADKSIMSYIKAKALVYNAGSGVNSGVPRISLCRVGKDGSIGTVGNSITYNDYATGMNPGIYKCSDFSELTYLNTKITDAQKTMQLYHLRFKNISESGDIADSVVLNPGMFNASTLGVDVTDSASKLAFDSIMDTDAYTNVMSGIYKCCTICNDKYGNEIVYMPAKSMYNRASGIKIDSSKPVISVIAYDNSNNEIDTLRSVDTNAEYDCSSIEWVGIEASKNGVQFGGTAKSGTLDCTPSGINSVDKLSTDHAGIYMDSAIVSKKSIDFDSNKYLNDDDVIINCGYSVGNNSISTDLVTYRDDGTICKLHDISPQFNSNILSKVSEGIYEIEYKATGANGNTSTVSGVFGIDKVKPKIEFKSDEIELSESSLDGIDYETSWITAFSDVTVHISDFNSTGGKYGASSIKSVRYALVGSLIDTPEWVESVYANTYETDIVVNIDESKSKYGVVLLKVETTDYAGNSASMVYRMKINHSVELVDMRVAEESKAGVHHEYTDGIGCSLSTNNIEGIERVVGSADIDDSGLSSYALKDSTNEISFDTVVRDTDSSDVIEVSYDIFPIDENGICSSKVKDGKITYVPVWNMSNGDILSNNRGNVKIIAYTGEYGEAWKDEGKRILEYGETETEHTARVVLEGIKELEDGVYAVVTKCQDYRILVDDYLQASAKTGIESDLYKLLQYDSAHGNKIISGAKPYYSSYNNRYAINTIITKKNVYGGINALDNGGGIEIVYPDKLGSMEYSNKYKLLLTNDTLAKAAHREFSTEYTGGFVEYNIGNVTDYLLNYTGTGTVIMSYTDCCGNVVVNEFKREGSTGVEHPISSDGSSIGHVSSDEGDGNYDILNDTTNKTLEENNAAFNITVNGESNANSDAVNNSRKVFGFISK